MYNRNESCLLHKAIDGNEKCGAGVNCVGCDWERKEANRRRELFRIHGLTQCSDGLYSLDIKKAQG